MIAEIVTAVSVAVTCTIALLVGYWRRKQLRQLELYRQDPGDRQVLKYKEYSKRETG